MNRIKTVSNNPCFRILSSTQRLVLLCSVLSFVSVLLSNDGFAQAPNSSGSDDLLIDQYIQTIALETIVFNASNIKQYWIDRSVINEGNKTISIHLQKKASNRFESIPLKIQLANVDESLRCTIHIITDTPNTRFWISNKDSKRISSSIDKEDFLHYQILSTDFHLKNTPDYAFNVNFSNSEKDIVSIQRIILSFDLSQVRRDIEEWNKPLPDLPQNTLLQNGDFETPLAGEPLDQLRARYAQQELPSYADPNRSIPAVWSFDIGSWCKDGPPDMSLVSENALAGQHSLSLESTSFGAGVFSNHILTRNNDCQYDLFVRNVGTGKVDLTIRTYSWFSKTDDRPMGYEKKFTLDPEKTYRIHDIITVDEMKPDADDFYFYINVVKGKVILDQFSLTNEGVLEN